MSRALAMKFRSFLRAERSTGGDFASAQICNRFPREMAGVTLYSMLGFGGSDLERFGHPDQIGHRSRSHFLHKMTAMHFHGDLAEADFGCDLFAHQSARHQSHDFALARGEG